MIKVNKRQYERPAMRVVALQQRHHLLDISDESCEDFDELLLERSPRGGYWLHFAVRPTGNRRKVRLIQSLR